MKTRLLPLFALMSMTACSSVLAANSAYVTDSNGHIVKDSYGQCVRSIDWSADKALAECSTPKQSATPSAASNPPAVATPAPTLLPPVEGDIDGQMQAAYAIDSEGRIVRDGYGYCVRTINWTKDTAIAKCEGWEEPKPVAVVKPVAVPKPQPVIIPAVKKAPVEVVEDTKPAAFVGFFDIDKAALKSTAKEKLNTYSEYMKRNDSSRVKVTGHTDSTGLAAYNQTLSEQRAQAVKQYLTETGIAAERIEAQGLGQTQPAASNQTKEGRAQNRRVELEIIK